MPQNGHLNGSPILGVKNPKHQVRLFFLEISYFYLEISCLQHEPKSLSLNPIKQAFSRTPNRLN